MTPCSLTRDFDPRACFGEGRGEGEREREGERGRERKERVQGSEIGRGKLVGANCDVDRDVVGPVFFSRRPREASSGEGFLGIS